MKVTFLANEIIDLDIIMQPIDFENIPLVGDFITIVDFLKDEDKEIFNTHLQSLNKVNLAVVDGRIWNNTNGENNIQLSLYFEDLGK